MGFVDVMKKIGTAALPLMAQAVGGPAGGAVQAIIANALGVDGDEARSPGWLYSA